MRQFSSAGPPISEGNNFFVRTLIRVFLDSMESPLSQDIIHVPVGDSGRSQHSEFYVLYQEFNLLSYVDVYSRDIT